MDSLPPQDMRILQALVQNARITNKALAQSVGLSQSGCLERVRKLEARGVLAGYHAEIPPEAVGVGIQALVGVRLRRHTRRVVARFRSYVIELPEVVSLFHVTGEFDFFVEGAARDMDHLRDFGLDALTTRPEVQQIQTSLMFEAIRRPGWPGVRPEAPVDPA
ncbi:MAG: Lrp/AsnC family transcriptional regulator [Gemmatimonadetes bacterium]|nr:Lrp/AsnC family transcriptional regulator [Gemmatimonadota bacterium]